PGPAFGELPVRVNVGPAKADLTGTLPLWAERHAFRAVHVPLESGLQAGLVIPAAPELGWLGRYQALYLLALAGLVVFALVWGLLPVKKVAQPAPVAPREQRPRPTPALGSAAVVPAVARADP